jgi:hypothetical protein
MGEGRTTQEQLSKEHQGHKEKNMASSHIKNNVIKMS